MTTIELFGTKMTLLREKALFLPSQRVLIIADVHLGKSQHFRKSGIPIPPSIGVSDMSLISELISTWAPSKLIFAGDFFHSTQNNELSIIRSWVHNTTLEMHLVVGNHDMYSVDELSEAGLICSSSYVIDNVIVCHDVADWATHQNSVIIGGHIHPAVRLRGSGRQNIKLPCFYIEENRVILPSFGTFTGSHIVDIGSGSSLFAVTNSHILTVSNNNPFVNLVSNE